MLVDLDSLGRIVIPDIADPKVEQEFKESFVGVFADRMVDELDPRLRLVQKCSTINRQKLKFGKFGNCGNSSAMVWLTDLAISENSASSWMAER